MSDDWTPHIDDEYDDEDSGRPEATGPLADGSPWEDTLTSEEDAFDQQITGYRNRAGTFYVEGLTITPEDHPECLDTEDFDCSICAFFNPLSCPLLSDPLYREEIRDFWNVYEDRQLAELQLRKKLRNAVYFELKTHGRALHYSVLAKMVIERYPELGATEDIILSMLKRNTNRFEWVNVGVYVCK